MKQATWIVAAAAVLSLVAAGCSKEEAPTPPPAPQQAPTAGMEHAKEAAHQGVEQTHEAMKETHAAMKEAHEGVKESHQSAMADMESGKAVYEKNCAACHATGVAGAPKTGDKTAWAGHLAEGIDHLVEVAMKGEGAMPAKGGNPDLSEEEIRAAVTYMLDQSR